MLCSPQLVSANPRGPRLAAPGIPPKTADHHIQHVYTKIGVSSRGVAALWAMQHAVVN